MVNTNGYTFKDFHFSLNVEIFYVVRHCNFKNWFLNTLKTRVFCSKLLKFWFTKWSNKKCNLWGVYFEGCLWEIITKWWRLSESCVCAAHQLPAPLLEQGPSSGRTREQLNPMDQYLPEETGSLHIPTQAASFDSSFLFLTPLTNIPPKPLRNMCGKQMIYNIRDRALLMCHDNSTTTVFGGGKMLCTRELFSFRTIALGYSPSSTKGKKRSPNPRH